MTRAKGDGPRQVKRGPSHINPADASPRSCFHGSRDLGLGGGITTAAGDSPLRARLEKAAAGLGVPLKALTVLDKDNDPFRTDVPARHRDGKWLADAAAELGLGSRPIHCRGLHYMLIGWPKPDGSPYRNVDRDWAWLVNDAAKASRFLGYLPFGQIVDQRNAAPVIREFKPPSPSAYLSTGIDVEIPGDITPELRAWDFRGTQPYRIVMIGEKSSLEPVLGPLAQAYEADLYLPTGECTDAMLHRMAEAGHADGRPMRVLYFSDCDPAGWQMPISVSRKLQAFETAFFPGLDFEVHRIALTPDQVAEFGLPSTPLKETERRADRWRQAMGVQQTEVDALASLRPDLLEQIARQALDGFYDRSLAARVAAYRRDWLRRANEVIDGYDTERIAQVRAEAEQRLAGMREQIAELNDQLRIDVSEDDLPPIELPEAADPGGGGLPPLVSSAWDFAEQCQALIGAKAYGRDAAS